MHRLLSCVWLISLVAFQASGAAQSPPGAPDVRAAVASLVEAEQHPLLKWRDITRYVGVLKEASAADADGLFWFEDGGLHRALGGAIQALGQAHAHGMEPSEFDAQTLATRWQRLQAGSGASALP
jgi:hypothetical protein